MCIESLSFKEREMKFTSILLVLLLSIPAQSTESFPEQLIVGDWVTMDHPFQNTAVRIGVNNFNKLIMVHCEKFKLQVTGECDRANQYEAVLNLVPGTETFDVNEGPQSPTPNFTIELDIEDGNVFHRSWGTEEIYYYRVD
jgi:hypothetical protein